MKIYMVSLFHRATINNLHDHLMNYGTDGPTRCELEGCEVVEMKALEAKKYI